MIAPFYPIPNSRIGFLGNRFDDIFVGSISHESSYGWTGGNDQFVGQEGVDNSVWFDFYKAYAIGEFGENHTDGVDFTIDDGDTTITTDFGSLKAFNLTTVSSSELDDAITLQNMDYFTLYTFGGTDTINANNIELNANLYAKGGEAGKYVINDYNQSSVIRIDEGVFRVISVLPEDDNFEVATSVYRADGNTYVDLRGINGNNSSIEKIITLNGEYALNEMKIAVDSGRHDSYGLELRFSELDNGAFRLTESDDDFTDSKYQAN